MKPFGCHYPGPDLGVDRNCIQRGSESVEPLASYSTARNFETSYIPPLLSAIMRPIFPIRLTLTLT